MNNKFGYNKRPGGNRPGQHPDTHLKMSRARKSSASAQQQIYTNLQKMIELNTGKNRPEHSSFMKIYNHLNPKSGLYHIPEGCFLLEEATSITQKILFKSGVAEIRLSVIKLFLILKQSQNIKISFHMTWLVKLEKKLVSGTNLRTHNIAKQNRMKSARYMISVFDCSFANSLYIRNI